ncbi:MAG: hypothetical protein AB7G37_01105 [Solirubrobacteraceae bacterium]
MPRESPPTTRMRLRHPDGGVVDVYLPMDVSRAAEVFGALGRAGFELRRDENGTRDVERMTPPTDVDRPPGPWTAHATVEPAA